MTSNGGPCAGMEAGFRGKRPGQNEKFELLPLKNLGAIFIKHTGQPGIAKK